MVIEDYKGFFLRAESFYSFWKKGIHLLDEPEAALSPLRQLSFLRLLHEMEKEAKAQFIIATHSPILLAYPGATIYNFDNSPVTPISCEETSHYFITRRFLEKREEILRVCFPMNKRQESIVHK